MQLLPYRTSTSYHTAPSYVNNGSCQPPRSLCSHTDSDTSTLIDALRSPAVAALPLSVSAAVAVIVAAVVADAVAAV
jgi:hypothetical protein